MGKYSESCVVRPSISYLEAAEKMQQETGVTLRKYDAADNIDLNNIVIVC